MEPEVVQSRVASLHKELGTKKSFLTACRGLAELCETPELSPAAAAALGDEGKYAFRVLQTRFSNPKFWQAGLDFFLALEFHCPTVEGAAAWRDAALEEVDDDARERAQELARARKLAEDKKHNQGRFSDANTPVTMNELLAASGVVLVQDEDGRPGMSRDARNELRVVTVLEEDLCVVCQEAMPAGSKAKAMPCGHKFHDDCLISWVKKSNSCPTCRFDELPSERRHFDEAQRQVALASPDRSGLYA